VAGANPESVASAVEEAMTAAVLVVLEVQALEAATAAVTAGVVVEAAASPVSAAAMGALNDAFAVLGL